MWTAAILTGTGVVLAAEGDWSSPLVQYGAIGVILVLFVLGQIQPKVASDRESKRADHERDRADAAEERERVMRDKIDDRIAPVLAEVVRELTALNDARRTGR